MADFTTEKKEQSVGGDLEAVKTSFDNGVIELESMPRFSAEAEKRLVRKIDFRYVCFGCGLWEWRRVNGDLGFFPSCWLRI